MSTASSIWQLDHQSSWRGKKWQSKCETSSKVLTRIWADSIAKRIRKFYRQECIRNLIQIWLLVIWTLTTIQSIRTSTKNLWTCSALVNSQLAKWLTAWHQNQVQKMKKTWSMSRTIYHTNQQSIEKQWIRIKIGRKWLAMQLSFRTRRNRIRHQFRLQQQQWSIMMANADLPALFLTSNWTLIPRIP